MEILLADDDELYRKLLSVTLGRWGYQVVMAEDGEQALARLSGENAPTLAILDWMMPGLSGLEICQHLRARPGPRYIYLLLLTARDRTQDLVAGLEAGADDYLTKPFDVAELRARLRAAERILDLQEQLLRSRKELEDLATHDPLTQLWNRRAIFDRLSKEAARAEREAKCVAVILVDVDHFKTINDTHGHPAGDQVLCEVARRMAGALRPYDLLGRFGGDEFLVALIAEDPAATEVVAERLRAAVSGIPVRVGETEITVTVSIGAASASPHVVHSPEALLHAADEALYLAKREGRNRVCAVLTHPDAPSSAGAARRQVRPSPAASPSPAR